MKKSIPILIRNKKAFFHFEILEKYTAGIVLKGSEVKAIRQQKVNLQDAYAYFSDQELWLKGMHISPYQGNLELFGHDPLRKRKLLLHRRELKKLRKKKEEKGMTIVVLGVFINAKNLVKVDIALARGKKKHDKRRSIMERDVARRLAKRQVE